MARKSRNIEQVRFVNFESVPERFIIVRYVLGSDEYEEHNNTVEIIIPNSDFNNGTTIGNLTGIINSAIALDIAGRP